MLNENIEKCNFNKPFGHSVSATAMYYVLPARVLAGSTLTMSNKRVVVPHITRILGLEKQSRYKNSCKRDYSKDSTM